MEDPYSCSTCGYIIDLVDSDYEDCQVCSAVECHYCVKKGRYMSMRCLEGEICLSLFSDGKFIDTLLAYPDSNCKCTVGIENVRGRMNDDGYVCKDCLTVDNPNKISTYEVMKFLLSRSVYKTDNEVKEIMFYRKKIKHAEIKFLLLLTTRNTMFNDLPSELRRMLIHMLFSV